MSVDQKTAPAGKAAAVASERFALRLTALLTIGITSVVIAGWRSGTPRLITFVPGSARMVMTTAVCLLICSLGLLALAAGGARLARICGAIIATYALLGLVQFAFTLNFGVEGWLLKHVLWVSTNSPGLMGPNSGAALFLVGVTLMLRSAENTEHWWLPLTGGALISLALFPLVNNLGSLAFGNAASFYHGIAVPTSINLLLLAVGLGWRHGPRFVRDGTSLPLFAAALGIVLSLGILSVQANADLVEANGQLTRAYQVQSDIDRLVSQVARMESTVRAFALTGEESFRKRYFDHRAEILDKLGELQRLFTDNAGQSARAVELDSLARAKLEQNADILRARLDGGAGAAAAALDALHSAGASAFVNLADVIQREETRLLQERDLQRARIERTARIEQIGGSLFALGLITAAVAVAGRSAKVRNEAEKRLRTANATLATSEERFRQAFEFAGIGMALVAPDGRWLRVNKSVCDIVGYEPDDLAKRTFQDITHPDDLKADLGFSAELLEGKRRFYQMEKRYIHRLGHVVWIELTASLVRDQDGKPLYFISQIEDITDRKRLEENLLVARDEALESSRLKSAFLANMSHEIRTPMNAVIGMSDLLADSRLDTGQKELLHGIQSGAESLLTVIDDILDFSKIEAGKLRFYREAFDLRKLVTDTIAFLEARAREKRLHLFGILGPNAPLVVMGDPGRVRQVLTNIIGNAIKFTDRGEVDITLEEKAGQGDRRRVRVTVRDTGIGIAPEAQKGLFQPFIQVESTTTRRFGGTGLGLAISRQIVELMGGEIGVKSEPGKGSTFWFEVEFDRAAMPDSVAQAAPAGRQGGARRLRVLVVDDNVANQTVARLMLTSLGHSVEIAADGEAALARLKSAAYDCIFMDCQMPVLDGYETTRLIRAGAVPGLDVRIPIIAFTAYAMREDQAKCLAAGMDDYIAKPILVPDLVAVLQRRGLDV